MASTATSVTSSALSPYKPPKEGSVIEWGTLGLQLPILGAVFAVHGYLAAAANRMRIARANSLTRRVSKTRAFRGFV